VLQAISVFISISSENGFLPKNDNLILVFLIIKISQPYVEKAPQKLGLLLLFKNRPKFPL
jgi:hypothetical protein